MAPAALTTPCVVNLMDALKKSLDSVSAGKKKTAKASVGKSDTKRHRKAS